MTPLPPDPDAEPEPDPEPPVGDSATSPESPVGDSAASSESESSTSTSTTTTTAGPRGAPRRNWRVLLLTALAGVCVPLAAPPFDLAPLAFVSPALLWFVLRGRRPRDGLLLGLTAGLCANLVGFRWTVGLLQDFASLPLALCVLLWLLLALAQSLGWAATGFVVAWLEHRRGIAPRWTLPAALVVAEWAVPSVFPWTLALTQHRVLPLVQIAEWTGTAGPALVVAAAGTLLGEAVTVRRLRPALVAVALVGMTALQGSWRLGQLETAASSRPLVRVGVAQPSIGIFDKHDPSRRSAHLRNLQELTTRLEAQGADLVVWPESAYPYPLSADVARDGARGMPRIRKRGRVPILFGALSRSHDRRHRYNSAFLVDAEGLLAGPVHKTHLLLFGETVPFYRQLDWLRRAFPRAEGFTAGPGPGVLAVGPIRAGVFNCYEDILAEFGREMVAVRPSPTLLVNITNDAWFGDTAEPHLHNALATFRSIELRREMIRAVNTGVSSHIDVTGRIVRQTHPFERTTLLAEARLWEGQTVYARFGDVLPWACAVLLAALALTSTVTRRFNKRH